MAGGAFRKPRLWPVPLFRAPVTLPAMNLELDHRTALVTGATRGIGRAIALGFARERCRLVICARGERELRHVTEELREAGAPAVRALAVDVTHEASADALIAAAEELGGLDVVVSSAGGNRHKRFEDTTDGDWRELLELNAISGLRLARAAIPSLRRRGGGAITFIASIWGREAGGVNYTLYNASKSALISAAKVLATELAPERIRVNTVAPGSIRFPGGGWDRRMREDPEGISAFVGQNMPLDRFGTVDEVADVAAFLLSDRASLVTGACIPIDGAQGRTL